MRVLHVDPSHEWRGGQVQLVELVRDDPNSQVLCAAGSPLHRALLGQRCQVHPYPMRSAWCGVGELRRLCQTVDLVAAHSAHAHMIADRAGIRAVVHRRVDFPIRRVQRYRRAAGIIAVSHAVANVLEQAGLESRVVHDGVPAPQKPAPTAIDAPDILAVGALVPHKDHATLIRAMERVPGKTLWILGEGPLKQKLQKLIDVLGLQNQVFLEGWQPSQPLLGQRPVFAHSSREEGLGQVVIEALWSGCPVVATRAGGVPEVVGADGWLVPPRSPHELAKYLNIACHLGDAAQRRASRAKRRLERQFSLDAMREGTWSAYQYFAGLRE